MPLYYSGLNPTSLFSNKYTLERFTEIPFGDCTDVYINWNYLLLRRRDDLWITGITGKEVESPKKLEVPDSSAERLLLVTGGTESITVLTSNDDVWRYTIYEDTWKKVPPFLPTNDEQLVEKIIKMEQEHGVVALTNLGRVFNVPSLVDMPKNVKFVDIACGTEHTVMLTDNGDVYTMGLGTRGQLGHGDLENCDEPSLVKALAGLRVSQISAAGWCSAVVTQQGDLYVWGWNNEGQMGTDEKQKVIATPMIVDFKTDTGELLDVQIVKVQCTSSYIICLTDGGELWACGSNKYGQLGQETKKLPYTRSFVKLSLDLGDKCVKDVRCKVRGTIIEVE